MTMTLKLGLVQRSCTARPQDNLDAVASAVTQAASAGATLILLPELHNTRYFCQSEDPRHFDLAEPLPGPTTDRLAGLAQSLQVVIVASVFERRAAGVYHNTAVVLDRDGGIAGRYRKMHIPDDPGYHEKFYFTPGDLGFRPVDTSLGRLGILVCWDQWYPEAARLLALAGAEILLCPTAIGYDPADDLRERDRQHQSWLLIQRAHAIANGLPLAACNRTGREPHPRALGAIEFWGSSFVCGPQGEILYQAGQQEQTVPVVNIDRRRTEQVRRIWPFLRDRRIDAYSGLGQRLVED